MMRDNVKPVTGTLSLRAYDRAGRELWRDEGHNLIVASGHTSIVQALAGITGHHITKVAIGTNGTAPADTDTAITDPILLNISNIEYPKAGTVRFNFAIGYDDANNIAIREFGLIMADGGLFSRRVREPLEKTEDMTISGMWDISTK